jgi:hypothetical protein
MNSVLVSRAIIEGWLSLELRPTANTCNSEIRRTAYRIFCLLDVSNVNDFKANWLAIRLLVSCRLPAR